LVLVAFCGFAALFVIIGALVYFYGWRFLTFNLIGGFTSRLLGGRYQESPDEEANKPGVVPPHLDAQAAVEQLPDFHATVAKYRSQETLTVQPAQTAAEEVNTDTNLTVDPGAAIEKSDFGVRYASDRPGRLLRDRRYKRVRGPDSGDDPEVYHGMFEKKGE
jgi:hypothetical protein